MQTSIKVHTITLEVDDDWHNTIAQATSPEYFFGAEVCNWIETGPEYDKIVYTCDSCSTLIDIDQFDNLSPHPDYCIDCYECNACGDHESVLGFTDEYGLLCPKCLENDNED